MALGAPLLSLQPLLCPSEPCPHGRDAHPRCRTRSALCARPPPGTESRVELGTAQIIPASLQNWDSDVWMAGQRVGTAEQELRERWERRLLCTVTAAQPGPSASSADPLPPAFPWTCLGPRSSSGSQRGSQRAEPREGPAACRQLPPSPEQRWSEWERSPCWRNQ